MRARRCCVQYRLCISCIKAAAAGGCRWRSQPLKRLLGLRHLALPRVDRVQSETSHAQISSVIGTNRELLFDNAHELGILLIIGSEHTADDNKTVVVCIFWIRQRARCGQGQAIRHFDREIGFHTPGFSVCIFKHGLVNAAYAQNDATLRALYLVVIAGNIEANPAIPELGLQPDFLLVDNFGLRRGGVIQGQCAKLLGTRTIALAVLGIYKDIIRDLIVQTPCVRQILECITARTVTVFGGQRPGQNQPYLERRRQAYCRNRSVQR